MRRASAWHFLLLLGIISAGAFLRFQMLEAFYLDYDEAMHFEVAKESDLASVYEASKVHTHPPLIFLFYHFWIQFGNSELFLRLPSLIFGVCSLGIAYVWLREIAGKPAATIGLTFLAFAPVMIRLSYLMRSYSLLLCFFFGALYFNEKLMQQKKTRWAVGLTVCLSLAVLTHYSGAWFTFVLGSVTLYQLLRRRFPFTVAAWWFVGQLSVLFICVWLYMSHVRGFVQSSTREALWNFWLRDVHASSSWGFYFKLVLIKTLQFAKFTFGTCWFLVPLLIGYAIWAFYRDSRSHDERKAVLVSRIGLLTVPFVIANILLCLQIYPFGPTRHSSWLIPFLLLAIAVSLSQLFDRGRRGFAVTGVVLIGSWIITESIVPFIRFETPMSIAGMEQATRRIRDGIPKDDVIIVDDATRHVLDYYLGRDQVNPTRELSNGFHEYQMGGYRLIVVPKFYMFEYNLRENWCKFLDCSDTHDHTHFWIMYLGYGDEMFSLRNVAPLLPRGKSVQHWQIESTQVLRIEFPVECPDQREKALTEIVMKSPSTP